MVQETEANPRTSTADPCFACQMGAIPPAEREQHRAAIEEIFGAVQEVRETPEGYSFRLPGEAAWLTRAAGFIARERLCCPFFTFGLVLEPAGGALWLSLTGPEGVKEVIRAEIGGALEGLWTP